MPSDFGRSDGDDIERVYIAVHHIAEAIIHQPMPRNAVEARKTAGYKAQAVMPGAGRRARMACMQMGLVDQLTLDRIESCGEAFANAFETIAHCVSFRYFDRYMLCPTMKAIIIPVKPNSLKSTHAAVEKW